MAITNDGFDFVAGAVIGDEATVFDNANAALGVGTSTTAFAATQSDLQGVSKLRKGMQTAYPERNPDALGSDYVRFKSQFDDGEAEFAWEEWGVFNNTTGGTMLSRKVSSNGTKTAGNVWILEVDLQFT